ncbi:MAG: hypothetical protein WCP15_00980 [bacterium]
MSNEEFQNTIETPQEPELSFEVKPYKEGVTLYVFKDLAVAIDITGKNYKALPELFFGPYDNALNTGSLNQPVENKKGVDMQYVSECIKKVAEVSGIHRFWFYPFGDDATAEKRDRRESARMRLFAKMSSKIEPAPEGHGYIVNV